MNDNACVSPAKQPDLTSMVGRFYSLSDTRDVLIYDINDTIDRMKANREPANGLKSDSTDKATDFVRVFAQGLDAMDVSNEKLSAILRRLRDLV